MDKAEALAFVSTALMTAPSRTQRLGRQVADQAVHGQCSRTNSAEDTQRLPREIGVLSLARAQHPTCTCGRLIPAFCQDWVDDLRQRVEAGDEAQPTTAGSLPSALCTDGHLNQPFTTTGVPRNPMPPRSLAPWPEDHQISQMKQFWRAVDISAIARAALSDLNASVTTCWSRAVTWLQGL